MSDLMLILLESIFCIFSTRVEIIASFSIYLAKIKCRGVIAHPSTSVTILNVLARSLMALIVLV